ncbi:MAG: beta-ketoacyl-[acyl-carrier-protein] synthase family protein [Desulfocapsa sp.]|nr:beta-ketoacyl-[acyl-carrier-protein] synthase family protein [Desulfocapsa sp.]
MSSKKITVSIAGIGIISPLGIGLLATEQALRKNRSAITPLTVFPVQHPSPLPVGQVQDLSDSPLPRTHRLAITAANQAMGGYTHPPDAVILGSTTGGILRTEALLAQGEQDPEKYRYHGLSTVAEEIAREVHCTGQALTVSTACSSGSVAISMALKMLQADEVQWVLAGGADSLCRLTYFGFHSLQLVDQEGSRPFDKNRRGMSVAEGAALLLLTNQQPTHSYGQILGCGLSCDAYHSAAPHPQGQGAAAAMKNALDNACLAAADIGYINLHGTGTPDNDLAESRAVRKLFDPVPPLSSIKGLSGHGLAASGAIEAAVTAICLERDLLPANTGCLVPDPECKIHPIKKPEKQPVSVALSNSFGFGGNNACLVIGRSDNKPSAAHEPHKADLTILGKACITGAGHTKESMEQFFRLESMAGTLDLKDIAKDLAARKVRRLKRFSQMALALATSVLNDAALEQAPHSVFMGSGWGALSETHDFLDKLQSSKEQFPSPIDFVGSVHNSAAGQIAIMHGATGANITCSGGDYSFEQALLTADNFLRSDEKLHSAFVLAADEFHEHFSPLFDPSVDGNTVPADGGGGFYLCRGAVPKKTSVRLCFFSGNGTDIIDPLIAALGGKEHLQNSCGMILAGIPAAFADDGEIQLDHFMQQTGLDIPVIHYRKFTGEFASASSVAAVMATHLLESGEIAVDKKVLVLGFGKNITAMEFGRQ